MHVNSRLGWAALLAIALAMAPHRSRAEVPETKPPPPPATIPPATPGIGKRLLDMTRLSAIWHLSYVHGESSARRFNRFQITRGYLSFGFKPVEWFNPRVTLDTRQNSEGDWVVRLKYLYAGFVLPVETRVVSDPSSELGLAHTPWFAFEEEINRYRLEGTMFLERNGVMNTADLGVMASGLLGRKLSRELSFPGTWGSFAMGLYNGSGFRAAEMNNDKAFMARVTVRPLGALLPEPQLTYSVVYGKGNAAPASKGAIPPTPDWLVHLAAFSVEHRFFAVLAQYVQGKGNQEGTRVLASGEATPFRGYSFFAEGKLPWIRSAVIGRFDWFNWNPDGGTPASSRVIAGYAFYFLGSSYFLLSLDRVSSSGSPTDWQVLLGVQVALPP